MEIIDPFIQELKIKYKTIFINGETLYINNDTHIVYQFRSYFEKKELNGKIYFRRSYQLEEFGKYDNETHTIIYDDHKEGLINF
tara:strand:- start:100 stop:351 length:252 start_codon:yes stop_codon:yes gene_type:complete